MSISLGNKLDLISFKSSILFEFDFVNKFTTNGSFPQRQGSDSLSLIGFEGIKLESQSSSLMWRGNSFNIRGRFMNEKKGNGVGFMRCGEVLVG